MYFCFLFIENIHRFQLQPTFTDGPKVNPGVDAISSISSVRTTLPREIKAGKPLDSRFHALQIPHIVRRLIPLKNNRQQSVLRHFPTRPNNKASGIKPSRIDAFLLRIPILTLLLFENSHTPKTYRQSTEEIDSISSSHRSGPYFSGLPIFLGCCDRSDFPPFLRALLAPGGVTYNAFNSSTVEFVYKQPTATCHQQNAFGCVCVILLETGYLPLYTFAIYSGSGCVNLLSIPFHPHASCSMMGCLSPISLPHRCHRLLGSSPTMLRHIFNHTSSTPFLVRRHHWLAAVFSF